jgi:dTDP-4-dehydrorhamnose reductase
MEARMKNTRILLLGKNGQVGWELQRTLAPLGQVLAADSPEIDLTDPDGLRRTVLEHRPDVLVNAAAYTAVDRAESEFDRARAINGRAPGVLAEAARKIGAWLVHYSTDYVFDGTKTEPYLESDTPHPVNAYGRSKLEGDQAVAVADGKHLIFRLCWVYSDRGHNFMLTIQRLAREGKPLRVVSDQLGSPTWSRLIAEVTAQALQRVLVTPDAAGWSGTYHLAAGGITSWHGFASRIVEWMPETERRIATVLPISTSEYSTPAKRPAYSVLGCDKLKRAFGLQLPDWEEGLRLVLGRP